MSVLGEVRALPPAFEASEGRARIDEGNIEIAGDSTQFVGDAVAIPLGIETVHLPGEGPGCVVDLEARGDVEDHEAGGVFLDFGGQPLEESCECLPVASDLARALAPEGLELVGDLATRGRRIGEPK